MRSCVHCGFCNATCPTYQVEGNELDGPRGRIYLIKSMLEGNPASELTREHLDRCLTCRACESTCPSGVQYHHLLAIGRDEVVKQAPRPLWQRLARRVLVAIMSRRDWVKLLVAAGRPMRFLLPRFLKHYLSQPSTIEPTHAAGSARKVVLAQGCVQAGMTPATRDSVVAVLAALDIAVAEAPAEQCCGALAFHLDQPASALDQARNNIDTWEQTLADGAEAIISSASACGLHLKEYPELLKHDPDYAERAIALADKVKDISEYLVQQNLEQLQLEPAAKVIWHCPCTGQHGQNLDTPVREVLTRLGFQLPQIRDAHLCCGSAGTYGLFYPERAGVLRDRKLQALQRSEPDLIATANVGCQLHLSGGTDVPVVHWIELVARELQAKLH